MKKKSLKAVLAMALSAALLLTGCTASSGQTEGSASGGGSETTAGVDAAQGSSEGKEVVRMVVPGLSEETTIDPISGIEKKGIGEFEAFLEEQIPEYDINLVSIPWDGWIQKMETLVTSGEVDVGFYTNQEAVPDWYIDLTDYLNEDEEVNFDTLDDLFIEPAVYYTRYNSFNYPESTGQVFGLPMTMASNIIVYDRQLFQEWGVEEPTADTTFSELVDMAEQMTGKNPVTGQTNYGGYLFSTWMEWFAISYDAVKTYESDTMLLSEMDTQEYVEYIKDSPEVLNYFTDMIRLVDCCPEGVATGSGSEKFFTPDNDIAINFDTNNVSGNYMKYVYAQDTETTDRFVPLLVPTGENGMEGFPEFFRFSITKSANNPDAAWEVIKKLTTTPEIVDFYLTNYAQDKISALADTSEVTMMDYEINKQRHEYQINAMFRTDDYWFWRTPLQAVNNQVLSKQLTPEEAREAFYTGVSDWVNNTKAQLGQ